MTDSPEWSWALSDEIWPFIVNYSLIDSILTAGEDIYRITSETGKNLHGQLIRKLEIWNLEKGIKKHENARKKLIQT